MSTTQWILTGCVLFAALGSIGVFHYLLAWRKSNQTWSNLWDTLRQIAIIESALYNNSGADSRCTMFGGGGGKFSFEYRGLDWTFNSRKGQLCVCYQRQEDRVFQGLSGASWTYDELIVTVSSELSAEKAMELRGLFSEKKANRVRRFSVLGDDEELPIR